MQFIKSLAFAAAFATSVQSAAVQLQQRTTGSDLKFDNKISNSAALNVFQNTPVVLPIINHMITRQSDPEPDPNRNITTPELIFVLQCTDGVSHSHAFVASCTPWTNATQGFQGDCLVYGAKPGDCVSYFNFQAANSTEISDRFNNKVSSLSTNTGGNCQFYSTMLIKTRYLGCNNKGDDRGLTADYVYNLAVPLPDDPRIVEYENIITSWRC
ncbi:hypothetical protein J1614_006600 [Plenodomus biglobosus]|nr:hypothetical protein J1614_006600 [Plenodomus biglobosus]